MLMIALLYNLSQFIVIDSKELINNMSSYQTTSQYIPHKESKNISIEQYKFEHPAQNSKQHFQELLTCHVCYCTVNSPMMCPNCAKLYCEACIKKCLQIKSQCPYCRKQIKGFSMLANCGRFVNEIVSIVQQLIDKKMQQELCQDHNIALNYYCQQCLQPVCCQCSMFGKHKNHTLKQIGVIYEEYYQKLRQKLQKLKNQLNQKQINIKDIQGHLFQLKKLKQEQLSQISQYTNQYKNKILKNTAQDISGYERNIFEIDQYIKDIVQLEFQIINSLQQANKSGAFVVDQSLQKKVKEMTTRQITLHHKSKNVLEEVIPPYTQFHFVIKEFSQKRKERNIIFSPIEKIQGCQWRLKVYPNGNEGVEQNYLSVFIELVSSLQQNATYQYQIELINKKYPNQKMIRQYSSTFQAGQCWGYNKYIKLENLFKDGYIDMDTDQLEIRYYLRNPLYYNVYQQKKVYIQSLDDKILQQEAQLAELRKMLEESDQ